MRENLALGLLVQDGRVLLVKEDYGPHLWTLPGGNVEEGESFGVAAVREVKEETGLDARVLGIVAVRERPDQMIVIFALEPCGGELLPFVPGEIEAVAWFDRAALAATEQGIYRFCYAVAARALADGLPALHSKPWPGPDGIAADLFMG